MKPLSIEDWRRVERSLGDLFLKDGYNSEVSIALAYIAIQTLQNAEILFLSLPRLLEGNLIDLAKEETEQLLLSIHMVFGEHNNLREGERLLMRETNNEKA